MDTVVYIFVIYLYICTYYSVYRQDFSHLGSKMFYCYSHWISIFLPGAQVQSISITTNHTKVSENVNGTPVHRNSGEGGDIENCNFKIVSQNVKGLKTDKVKRETVFNYLKTNGNISFLQKTHSTPETEDLWKMNVDVMHFSLMVQTTHVVL